MRRAAAALAASGVSIAATFAGCALGLDEARIGAADADGGASADARADPIADSRSGSDGPGGSDGAPCSVDGDCAAVNACVVSRCDPSSHTCVHDVCPGAACTAASCDVASLKCSAPTAFGFHAAAIHVGAGAVGCGGTASRCIGASYPFVYVGTSSGVVAYDVRDPSVAAPAPIAVTGLPFLPTWIVTSGARVYFVGAVAGSGPSFKMPVAWIDPPGDPLATARAARTVLQSYGQPSVSVAIGGEGGSLFLVYGDGSKFFPTASLTAPLVDLGTAALFPLAGIPSGAYPVASSGGRLVAYRWTNDGNAFASFFSFETSPGTANAQNGGEQALAATIGPTYPQPVVATGAGGALLWMTPSVTTTDAGDPVLRAARMAWLVDDGTKTTFDATEHVDVETYQPPLPWGTPVAGPMAWIDPATAIVLAAAPGAQGQTSVQVASRKPSPSIVAAKRYVLPVSTGQVGLASSHGFAYVLAADAPDGATLHVFAPGCAP